MQAFEVCGSELAGVIRGGGNGLGAGLEGGALLGVATSGVIRYIG